MLRRACEIPRPSRLGERNGAVTWMSSPQPATTLTRLTKLSSSTRFRTRRSRLRVLRSCRPYMDYCAQLAPSVLHSTANRVDASHVVLPLKRQGCVANVGRTYRRNLRQPEATCSGSELNRL